MKGLEIGAFSVDTTTSVSPCSNKLRFYFAEQQIVYDFDFDFLGLSRKPIFAPPVRFINRHILQESRNSFSRRLSAAFGHRFEFISAGEIDQESTKFLASSGFTDLIFRYRIFEYKNGFEIDRVQFAYDSDGRFYARGYRMDSES